MSNVINVKKRNGRGMEPLQLEKMHKMVDMVCDGLAGVSASQVEIQSGIQFYDGISTAEIQEILVKSASDLISLDTPNYQYVAARLLLFGLRKSLYGRYHEHPSVKDHVIRCIDAGVYDKELLDLYSDEEYVKLQSFIDHDRDYLFTYAGLRQVADKYLVQDRSTGAVYETPQFMYLLIAASIFSKYPIETRLDYVRNYYNAISKHRINIPTPIMAGVRTPIRQFASCVLVDIDDTLDSIFSSDMDLLANMSHRGLVSVLTQVESGESILKSVGEKFSTQVLSPSSKNLKQLFVAVRRTVLEEDQLLSTFLSGIRKSKTSSSSKTTKEQKTTESENSTTVSS